MSPKAYVRPSKIASVIVIILGCGMLFFVGSSFSGNGGDSGFVGLWMLGLIIMIGYYAYNLIAKKASSVATEEIELDVPDSKSKDTVEETLSSLERMKKNKLITEEEYQQKRKEMMQQKW